MSFNDFMNWMRERIADFREWRSERRQGGENQPGDNDQNKKKPWWKLSLCDIPSVLNLILTHAFYAAIALGLLWVALNKGNVFINVGIWLAAMYAFALYIRFTYYHIDIEHRGVMTVFGARTHLCFAEGWVSLPFAPFVGMKEVDVRPHPLKVRENTVLTSDGQEVTFPESQITYKARDARKVLGIGYGVIDESVVELVLDRQRAYVEKKTLQELFGLPTLREDGTEGYSTPVDQSVLTKEIEKKTTKRSHDEGWGVEVTAAIVPSALMPQKVTDASSRVSIERFERLSERTELEFVKERMEALMEIPGMTSERAERIVQAERGKRTVTEVIGSEPVERAAGLITTGIDKLSGSDNGGN